MPSTPPAHTNRLIDETSPYLLQHAHNPVHWYAWGREALEAARREDKPILLSIGYSACHWCHVMERESFENDEIAELMNRFFINIKVDREERPDVDRIYMDFVQLTTGSGGWPLTVFLTPEQVPFFGGTYFPPEDRYGRPGFRTVLTSVADFYRSRRHEIENNRSEIVNQLSQAIPVEGERKTVSLELLDEIFQSIRPQFDNRYGGFGDAPKFPSPMMLSWLARYVSRRPSSPAREMLELTLNEMARGGIYDQLGGGFHRYSVDQRWLVPHFEKMLYDNALLARVYLEAFQLTGQPFFRQIAEETLRYVQQEMTDPQGGFYSAEDADSEGEEGRYYVWTQPEIEKVLGKSDAAAFCDYFDVTEAGNFEGRNILNHRRDLEGFARQLGRSPEEARSLLDRCRSRLLENRNERVRPSRDEKVLASWNGLMLAAFADAALVLADESFLQTALQNAEFLDRELIRDGRVLRSWKQGEARFNGYLDDYAHVITGMLAVFQASGDLRWLERARTLMEGQLEFFLDRDQGDFFFVSSDHETLIVRQKEYYDNATPSGNSSSALNLLLLAELTGRSEYARMAGRLIESRAALILRYPLGFGNWLNAIDFLLGPVLEIAVVGPSKEREKLLEPLRRRFLPRKVLVSVETTNPELEAAVPLLSQKAPLDGRATAFICRNFTCRQPVTDPAELEAQLEALES